MRILKLNIFVKSIICCIGLSACGGTPTQIDGIQFLAVNAGVPKNISLIPARELNCAQDDEKCRSERLELNKLQDKFESCIAKGLRRTAPNVSLIKKADIKDTDPVSMDYLVKITIENNSSEKKLVMDGAGDSSGFMLLIGQQWIKTAKVYSRIYDADTQQLAGELTADLTESASWFIPTFLVVPLPIPIVNNPNVENTSCTEMGEALGRFFMGAGNDYIR